MTYAMRPVPRETEEYPRYLDEEFRAIELAFAQATYGGVSQIGGQALSVTSTPQKMPFTSSLPSNGVTPDPANNEFVVPEAGNYELVFVTNHAASNSILMTFEPYVNGVPIGRPALAEIITQEDGANFAASSIIQAEAGDIISMWVSGSPSRTVTFDNTNYYVKGFN